MLVKRPTFEQHVKDLEDTFATLRKYGIRLNHTKCVFEVEVGEFLDFMVSHKEIEANPKQIKVVIDIKPPYSIRKIQRLPKRIAALNRFIFILVKKCFPFFQDP